MKITITASELLKLNQGDIDDMARAQAVFNLGIRWHEENIKSYGYDEHINGPWLKSGDRGYPAYKWPISSGRDK